MKRVLLIALLALFVCNAVATIYYQETFPSEDWESRWVQSKARSDFGKFKLSHGQWYGDAQKDLGIQTSQDARFYAITSKFDKPFSNEGKPLVIQFTVKHEQGIDCGGGYIKLLPADVDQENFNGESKYYIMFGPDICGPTKKIHLIFHYNGKNLEWKKKHVIAESDKFTHLYTVIINPDNTYEVQVDGKKKESGNLADDWDFLLPREIPDPNATKPADWVDEKEIPDPDHVKPEDYNPGPVTIPDPDAKKPEDWDDEEDGEWEVPQIPNPDYKGEWVQRMIPNPAYKGEWKAPMIDNPDFVDDKFLYRYNNIGAVGFDLWQVKSGSIFDNIIITDSVEEAKAFDDKYNTREAERKMYNDLEEAKKKKKEEEQKAAEAAKAAKEDEDDVEEVELKPAETTTTTTTEEVKPATEETKPAETTITEEVKPAAVHDEL